MFKLALLAAVFAFAQGGVVLPAAGYAGIHGYGLAAPAGIHGYGLAGPAIHAAAPVAYAAPAVAAPIAHHGYALPAVRIVEEAPIVQQVVEPVEQHGYSIRY